VSDSPQSKHVSFPGNDFTILRSLGSIVSRISCLVGMTLRRSVDDFVAASAMLSVGSLAMQNGAVLQVVVVLYKYLLILLYLIVSVVS